MASKIMVLLLSVLAGIAANVGVYSLTHSTWTATAFGTSVYFIVVTIAMAILFVGEKIVEQLSASTDRLTQTLKSG